MIFNIGVRTSYLPSDYLEGHPHYFFFQNIAVMSLFKPLTVSCSTQTYSGSGIDDLPVPILEKAVRLVEYFECEICSGGGDAMYEFF